MEVEGFEECRKKKILNGAPACSCRLREHCGGEVGALDCRCDAMVCGGSLGWLEAVPRRDNFLNRFPRQMRPPGPAQIAGKHLWHGGGQQMHWAAVNVPATQSTQHLPHKNRHPPGIRDGVLVNQRQMLQGLTALCRITRGFPGLNQHKTQRPMAARRKGGVELFVQQALQPGKWILGGCRPMFERKRHGRSVGIIEPLAS